MTSEFTHAKICPPAIIFDTNNYNKSFPINNHTTKPSNKSISAIQATFRSNISAAQLLAFRLNLLRKNTSTPRKDTGQ
ncbi:MAG: hypothetical protein DKT66_10240 [Candidatus Melainabacteria bacterium]|nr:MAG: hypothetical protein DKT66_10240 [Candidatus Melainabacteria bacterium]